MGRQQVGTAKRGLLSAAALSIGMLLALGLVELLSITWLTLQEGRYRSARELFQGLRNTYIEDITRSSDCRYIDTLFPHPYLAFVHHGVPPCGSANVNNVGLHGGVDFPFVRLPDRYVILLTGGSVAAQLGQLQVLEPRFLEEELNARFISPSGKPFLVLNGGAGAWKQPQQMILFSLYAEVIDAVVTLDGYNEQYAFEPGAPRFEYPANNFLEINPIVAKDGFSGLVTSWWKARAAGWLSTGVLANSHAAFLLASTLANSANLSNRDDAKRFGSMMAISPSVVASPEDHFSWQLMQYAKYIRIMDAIAKEFGIRAMFFLQPVPAVGKELTDEEKRGTPDIAYGLRYQRIAEGLERLRDGGIEVRGLLNLFEGEKDKIYADDIHPYRVHGGESRGYRMIANRMAREMARHWSYRVKSDQ